MTNRISFWVFEKYLTVTLVSRIIITKKGVNTLILEMGGIGRVGGYPRLRRRLIDKSAKVGEYFQNRQEKDD